MADTAMPAQKTSRGKVFVIVGAIAFCVVAVIAYFLCEMRIQNVTQNILNRQREIQQAWMDKTLDSIRVWQSELVSQARLVSSSEMFRLFMADTGNLDEAQLEKLSSPDSLHSTDETLRLLAEQHAYIQDLLKDLTQRRAWTEARIVNAKCKDIVTEEFASPLAEAQHNLVVRAVEKGQPVFGPVRHGAKGLVIDIADPLFEVMGMAEPSCIGAIVLTVPVDRTITTFLAGTGEQSGRLLSRIVDRSQNVNNVLFLRGNYLQMETLATPLDETTLPFEERKNLVGSGQVYSLGAGTPNLDWLLVVETPASFIQSSIDSEKSVIYGLGVAGSFITALLFAMFWSLLTSRSHKQRAQELEALNKTIEQQKMLLDSVNTSLQAGILMLDANGYIRVCNPAFCKICGVKPGTIKETPLAEVMRGSACTELIQAMAEMISARQSSKWLEVTIPNGENEKRLYRVHLMPYAALPEEKMTNGTGCVAIFEDITTFREKAKKRQKRERALLAAFDSAMASADPDLVGQTFKIDALAVMLADKLKLNEEQKETLRIGAMLSQIGKLFIPRNLLHKIGRYTQEEKEQVREARKNADEALDNYDFELPVQQTVREMNERMDGRGPQGLKGEQISLSGRVLAVANAFIALTNPRSWRNDSGKTIEEALDILSKDPGFDEEVIAALSNMDLADLYKCTKDSCNLGRG